MPRNSRKSAAAERRIKLALFIAKRQPQSFACVQTELADYAAAPGPDQEKTQLAARRLFERDKEELATRGVVIDTLPQGGFCVAKRNDAELVPGWEPFEPGSRQAHALRAACASLLQDPSYVKAGTLRCAMAKLCDVLEVPDSLQFAGRTSLDALTGGAAASQGLQRKAEQALSSRKLFKFDYPNAHGRQERRCVEPMGIFTANNCVYLAAWDTNKEAERCFRLDRMAKASVNGSGRGAPDFQPRPFDPQQWQVLPFQMGGAQDEPLQASVDVAPEAMWQARNLCSKHGTVLLNQDGSAVWYANCYSPVLLASWCIANGPGLVPQQPDQARQAYESLLMAAAGEGPACADAASSVASATVPARKSRSPQHSQRQAPPAAGTEQEDALFACLALLELNGSVSVPQSAQFLGVPEDEVYDALETLAFCYDVAGLRLELGQRGCSFARLPQTAGLSMSVSAHEAAALKDAAAALDENTVAQTLAQACAAEDRQTLLIEYWKEGDAAPAARTVFPKALIARNGYTYLQAWCCKAQDERLFRLDRIKSAQTVQLEHMPQALMTWRKQESGLEGVEARVTLAPGTRIPDWPGATIPKKPTLSGTVTVRVTWLGSPWLPKQVASMGTAVIDVEPARLLECSRDYARGLLRDVAGR